MKQKLRGLYQVFRMIVEISGVFDADPHNPNFNLFKVYLLKEQINAINPSPKRHLQDAWSCTCMNFSKFNPGVNPSMQAFGIADMNHGIALYH